MDSRYLTAYDIFCERAGGKLCIALDNRIEMPTIRGWKFLKICDKNNHYAPLWVDSNVANQCRSYCAKQTQEQKTTEKIEIAKAILDAANDGDVIRASYSCYYDDDSTIMHKGTTLEQILIEADLVFIKADLEAID